MEGLPEIAHGAGRGQRQSQKGGQPQAGAEMSHCLGTHGSSCVSY